MKLVGIDVGKNSHHFCVMDKETGELNVTPSSFSNNKEGFDFLINSLKPYSKKSILLGMEDTGHYHVALLKFLLSNGYTVGVSNISSLSYLMPTTKYTTMTTPVKSMLPGMPSR